MTIDSITNYTLDAWSKVSLRESTSLLIDQGRSR